MTESDKPNNFATKVVSDELNGLTSEQTGVPINTDYSSTGGSQLSAMMKQGGSKLEYSSFGGKSRKRRHSKKTKKTKKSNKSKKNRKSKK
jgi:hypothetical protein